MEFESDKAVCRWYVWQCFKEALFKIWWRIWNAHLLLWWYRLWIRQDEFDKSLEFDDKAYMAMPPVRRKWYYMDLCVRRRIAHDRGMREIKSSFKLIVRDMFSHLIPTAEWRNAVKDVDYAIAHKNEIMAIFDKTMQSLTTEKQDD